MRVCERAPSRDRSRGLRLGFVEASSSAQFQMWAALWLLGAALAVVVVARPNPTINDQSVRGYLTERTCWWNEICKEEFQTQFRCKCPQWSFCRSPGRYYNAYCTMTGTGYIWTQPERSWRV